MSYIYKEWKENDIYNFQEEFNRIESYNAYCQEWLSYFGIEINIENKTDWNIYDVVDIKDYNRVKRNINVILQKIDSNLSQLDISNQYNQNFSFQKANDLERRLDENLEILGKWQFYYNITGITTSGNSLKLGGVS